MRFDITFNLTDSTQNILPINYQYPMSSWMYRTLETVDDQQSERLHDTGYVLGDKQFKLFTFSNLRFGRYGYDIVRPDRLRIKKGRCWMTISLAVDKTFQSFITGIFENMTMKIGDKHSQVPMQVQTIRNIKEPIFEDGQVYRFKTLAPICVSDRIEGNRLPQYLSPEDANFERIFVNNLYNKYLVMLQNDLFKKGEESLPEDWAERTSFRLLSTPKRKIITIKDHTPQKTKYRAYMFEFEMSAPKILLKMGYQAGFGEKNSMGFGCCELRS